MTGMGTGSDAGAPGDHLPELPLTPDQQALLDDLQRPSEGTAVSAVEDSEAMIEAVEDDEPLPADVDTTPDPDTPRFESGR